ncbi:MAG: hypothetical protein WEB52_15100 [Dehalococcoidia bacterium]
MNVDPGVNVLSVPNHPLRLLSLFALSMLASLIVAGAAAALVYVIDDVGLSDVRGVAAPPHGIDATDGLVVVIPVEDAQQFEDLAGFAPFVPSSLPATTVDAPVMSVTPPDEQGRSVGRVSYSAQPDPVEGITGPLIVIIQAQGTPGEGVDGQLKRLTSGNGRTLVATLPCGDLVLDVQMYFGPGITSGEPFVTDHMKSTAESFVDGVKADCSAR